MRRRHGGQRGQAILEMALLAPVAIGLFALALQGGLVVSDQVALQHYALDGALFAEHNPTLTTGDYVNHVMAQLCDGQTTYPQATGTRFCQTGMLNVTAASTGLSTSMRSYRGQVAGVATGCDAWHLDVSPSPQTLPAQSTATYTVTLTDDSGNVTPPQVALAVSGLPAGVVAAFDHRTITGGGSSILTLSSTGQTTNGDYTLSFGGQDQCGSGPAPGPATATLTLTLGSGPPAACASTPSVFSPSPAIVAVNATPVITIPGTGFTPSTDVVTISSGSGSTAATVNVAGSSATSLSVTPSAGLPAGVYNLSVAQGGRTGVLDDAITVTNAATTQPVAPAATNPCDSGAGAPQKVLITITWHETLVVPWFTNDMTLTAKQFAYCDG